MDKQYFPKGTIIVPIQDHLFQAISNPLKFVNYQLISEGIEGFCNKYNIEYDILADLLVDGKWHSKRWVKNIIVEYMGGYEV